MSNNNNKIELIMEMARLQSRYEKKTLVVQGKPVSNQDNLAKIYKQLIEREVKKNEV